MEWIKIFDQGDKRMETLTTNKPQLLVVRGRRICLVRGEDRWFAVADACSHNGESLSKGSVNYKGEIVCPWHGQRFDLKTGREGEQRSRDIETYPVKLDEQGLFIAL